LFYLGDRVGCRVYTQSKTHFFGSHIETLLCSLIVAVFAIEVLAVIYLGYL